MAQEAVAVRAVAPHLFRVNKRRPIVAVVAVEGLHKQEVRAIRATPERPLQFSAFVFRAGPVGPVGPVELPELRETTEHPGVLALVVLVFPAVKVASVAQELPRAMAVPD